MPLRNYSFTHAISGTKLGLHYAKLLVNEVVCQVNGQTDSVVG